MNNPADRFMSPMSRPPAAKKQRGGATPPVVSRGGGGAAISGSASGAPPPPSNRESRGNRLQASAEDAIARRRAELRRLQAKRAGVAGAGAGAAVSVRGSAKPPPPSSTASAPPMKPAGVGRHYSDLFPTVPKSPSPKVARETLLEVSAGAAAIVPGLQDEEPEPDALKQPDLPTKLPLSGKSSSNANSTTTTTATTTKTPAVNRKLEFDRSTAASRNRAKSAPRERPPPPPLPPKGSGNAPPTSAARPGSAKPAAAAARPGTTSVKISPAADDTAKHQKKEDQPKTPHLIPSSKTKTVSALNETTPEPADLLKPKKLPVMSTPYPGKVASSPKSAKSSSSKREKLNQLRSQVEQADGAVESATTTATTSQKDEPPTPPRRPARSPPEQMIVGRTSEAQAASAASAPIPLPSATEKRLEEAYHKAENEKTAALVKIKELEDKLLQAQEEKSCEKLLPAPGSNPNFDVSFLVTLAETDGPVAAVEWAKARQKELAEGNVPSTPALKQSTTTSIQFAATPGSMVGLETPVRRRISSRTLTPHPKNMMSGCGDSSMPLAQVEYQKREQFKEAAQIVPFEFSSKLATFTVRRPYGLESNPQLFAYASPMPDQQYWKGAHVSTLSALEVAVTIHADNFVLLLFDVAGVRYKINSSNSNEWTVIPNVDDMMDDRPNLGHVSYIDEQANELEYSLDEILEEALLVREQYASNVTNMAFGLELRPPMPAAATAAPLEKAPSKDVGVETDEKGMTTDVPKNIEVDNAAGHKTQTAPPPSEDAHSGSSDVLTMFFSWILASVFGLIYYFVIGLPLKIVQTLFVLTVAYALFQMAYFYSAQDYNAWIIQENGGSVAASDLVYFFNTRLGIM